MGDRADHAEASPGQRMNGRIRELGDWRGETLAKIRSLVREAVPRRSRNGSGAPFLYGRITAYRAPEKPTGTSSSLLFARGAVLDVPAGLFNASLEGNVRPRHRPAKARRSTGRR